MSIYEYTKGRQVDVGYETGCHFVTEHLSETELVWTALSKTAEGAPDHESEPYSTLELGEGRYMVNWSRNPASSSPRLQISLKAKCTHS